MLPAGTALHRLATAVGCRHHGLDGLIQQHPEAPVLAVISWWLPLTAVSWHLCSHSDGVCLGEHHGVIVEGHRNARLPCYICLLALASSHWVLLLL